MLDRLKNLTRLADRLRHGTERVLERAGLSGDPVLCLTEQSLNTAGTARRVLDAIAASRRELPTVLDVLTDRAIPSPAVLLTVDATSPAVVDELVPALLAHDTACRLFVDPTRLDTPGALRGAELRAALGYGVVTGLALPTGLDAMSAHDLRGALAAGRDRITALSGVVCDTASTQEVTRSEVVRSELHRAGLRRLFVGQPGLASVDASLWPRLVIGRDVELEGLRELLDLDAAALGATIGRLRARRLVASRR